MILINQLMIPAARKGEIAVLQELIFQKADLNVRDEKGYTPLIIACYNNQYAAAELLLRNGADVNAGDMGGNTALMGAAFKGHADIVQLLIDYGADLNLQHGNGGSADVCCTFWTERCVKIIIGKWCRQNSAGFPRLIGA